jgi:RHS repeat-associated protein
MPIATVVDGVHYAVHADHLNTPRRLSDSAGRTLWQWPYSGFGEINPQSTPAAGQPAISYALRYPGQVDDGNGLFYNWHRFYDPRVGRYTKADPLGLEGGWNRFGYVEANPLGFVDPEGLAKGERGYGKSPNSTPAPGKHWKDDPKKPGWGWQKDPQSGKPIYKKRPPWLPPLPPLRIIPLFCPLCNFLPPPDYSPEPC